MDGLKFTLSGRTAFFKKPEMNSYYYFSYGCIHKVALIGIFGAILGYAGYGQQKKHITQYPEFYEKLASTKVAIVPKNPQGSIDQKMQIFNNTVGYASYEQGGILNVRQMWLERPCWDIYVWVNSEETERLADMLLKKKCCYLPYLGSNDHFADISNVQFLQSLKQTDSASRLHSLFEVKKAKLQKEEDCIEDIVYQYREKLPIALDSAFHQYQLEDLMMTNLPLLSYNGEIYSSGSEYIVFL